MKRWLVTALCLTATACVCPRAAAGGTEPIDPNNPPEGLFSDEWTEVYLSGGKVGYGHSTMIRKGDRVRTRTFVKMSISRANVSVDLEVEQNTVETLAGEPLTFRTVMHMSNKPVVSSGTFQDGKVTIVSQQFGMEHTNTYKLRGPDGKPASGLMIWGLYRESLIRGFEPGTEYTVLTYSPDLRLDGPIATTTRIGEWGMFEHAGKTRRAQRVDVVIDAPMGKFDTVNWIDRNGHVLKNRINMAGLTMEMVLTDEATAVAEFIPAELFMNNTIPLDKPIPGKTSRRIVYRLTTKDGKETDWNIPDTGLQHVVKQSGAEAIVEVVRQNHDPVTKPSAPAATDPDLTDYLASNILIDLGDAALIKLAKQAAGGEKEPMQLADRLRKFVTDYIDDKNLGVGFATASEVCRSPSGDCSEHAVLLAALGRLNGLPSRVVTGLAYVSSFGGQRNLFGFHMWTEFWIDGRWVDFDAALRESDCSPTRIAFAANSLKETALAEMSFSLMKVIGQLDIEVLSIEPIK